MFISLRRYMVAEGHAVKAISAKIDAGSFRSCAGPPASSPSGRAAEVISLKPSVLMSDESLERVVSAIIDCPSAS